MSDLIAVDISYYQSAVDNSYTLPWLIFRGCDGSFVDPNAGANLAWCRARKAAGALTGYTVYVVYRPGQTAAILGNLNALGVPADAVIMVDVENWEGTIVGNHSTDINSLVTALATRQGGQSRVWAYANQADLAGIYPGRYSWLGLVVPSWGDAQPDVPGMVGWQYTDGKTPSGTRPTSSAPFGPCDHNVIFSAAHTAAGTGVPITPEGGNTVSLTTQDLINVKQAANDAITTWVRSPEFTNIIAQAVLACVISNAAVGLQPASVTAILGDIIGNVHKILEKS